MLRPRSKQRSFFDASYLVADQRRFEFARLYAREILPLVTDADFEGLYSNVGRPAVSPAQTFHLLVLAKIEGLSDRAAVHAMDTRLDFQVALGRRIDEAGFDSTRLVRFRERFLGRETGHDHDEVTSDEMKRVRLLFDRLIDRLVELGLVTRGQAVRLDSTHIESAAKNINRYQTIHESMRLAIRAVGEAAPALLASDDLAPLQGKYLESPGAYDLKKESVRKNLETAAKDALLLLSIARENETLAGLAAVRLLDRALKDNVEIRTKGSAPKKRGRRSKRSAEEQPPSNKEEQPSEQGVTTLGIPGLLPGDVEVVERQGGDRMITPHDPSARLGVKNGGKKRWTGAKLHAAETVPQQGSRASFIVDGEVTAANVPDVTQALPTLQRLKEIGFSPEKMLVDAGYVSGETIALAEQDYGTDLVGPPAQPRASGRLPVELFRVDYERGFAVCPADQRSERFSEMFDESAVMIGAQARFAKEACAACPLAQKCLASQEKSRSVTFTRHHTELVEQRRRARTQEFKTEYRQRSPCEGIFADLAGRLRLRRSSVKGTLKVCFEQFLGLVAINIKRLHKTLKAEPVVCRG